MVTIAPAVLAKSRQDFDREIQMLAAIPEVSRIQLDIVDGAFARPASWPYTAPEDLAARLMRGETLPEHDRIAYEMDLMCYNAAAAVETWFALGASRFVIHAESELDLPALIARLRKRYAEEIAGGHVTLGVALNLASDITLLEAVLPHIGYVQFMGIAAIGQQGRPFDRRVFEKVRRLRERHPEVPIQVDGGISLDTARELVARGVSGLVVGSAIVRAGDPRSALQAFSAL